MADGAIRVEGVRELTRALAHANREVGKRIAERNRRIGAAILFSLQPTPIPVGAGAGASPRAVASRNMIAIRAGGTHRQAVPVQQWGRRHVDRDTPRPFILGAALREAPNIEKEYLRAIEEGIRDVSAD